MKLVVDDARGGDKGGGDRGDGGGQEIDVAGGGDGGGGPRSSVAHLDPESRLAAQEDRIADLRAAVGMSKSRSNTRGDQWGGGLWSCFVDGPSPTPRVATPIPSLDFLA